MFMRNENIFFQKDARAHNVEMVCLRPVTDAGQKNLIDVTNLLHKYLFSLNYFIPQHNVIT